MRWQHTCHIKKVSLDMQHDLLTLRSDSPWGGITSLNTYVLICNKNSQSDYIFLADRHAEQHQRCWRCDPILDQIRSHCNLDGYVASLGHIFLRMGFSSSPQLFSSQAVGPEPWSIKYCLITVPSLSHQFTGCTRFRRT